MISRMKLKYKYTLVLDVQEIHKDGDRIYLNNWYTK